MNRPGARASIGSQSRPRSRPKGLRLPIWDEGFASSGMEHCRAWPGVFAEYLTTALPGTPTHVAADRTTVASRED